MRKNLLIIFLSLYSAGATLGNDALCQQLQPCVSARALLDEHSVHIQSKREAIVEYVERLQEARRLSEQAAE